MFSQQLHACAASPHPRERAHGPRSIHLNILISAEAVRSYRGAIFETALVRLGPRALRLMTTAAPQMAPEQGHNRAAYRDADPCARAWSPYSRATFRGFIDGPADLPTTFSVFRGRVSLERGWGAIFFGGACTWEAYARGSFIRLVCGNGWELKCGNAKL